MKRHNTDDLLDEIQEVIEINSQFTIAKRVDRVLRSAAPAVVAPEPEIIAAVDVPLLAELGVRTANTGCIPRCWREHADMPVDDLPDLEDEWHIQKFQSGMWLGYQRILYSYQRIEHYHGAPDCVFRINRED